MFSAISNWISNPRISEWNPNDPLPSGSNSSTQSFKIEINSNTEFNFISLGSFAHGTILFQSSSSTEELVQSPPSYESLTTNIRTAEDEKRQGGQINSDSNLILLIEVESRYNNSNLFEETDITLKEVNNNVIELRLKTPIISPSKLLSQISFHIKITFPSNLINLSSLKTNGGQWKTLGTSNLSNLTFLNTSIKTSNAEINFKSLETNSLTISTSNGKVLGNYQIRGVAGGNIRTSNKKIEANIESSGPLSITTSNASIDGQFSSDSNLSLHTVNSELRGNYTGTIVTLVTVNGKISGNLSTSSKAKVSSCNGSIELKVKCLDELSVVRSTTPDLLEITSSDSKISTSNSLPSNPKTIEIKVSTANSRINIDYEELSRNIILLSQVSTSNAPISLKHIGFEGSFELSTSNSFNAVAVPRTHHISYSSNSSTKSAGTISQSNGSSTTGGSRSVASTSNSSISLVVV